MEKQKCPKIRFNSFNDAWNSKQIENILKIKSGMSQKHIEVERGIYPILATGGEIGRTNTPIYDKESVLIGRKGTIDKPYYMNSPFWTVDTLFYSELSSDVAGFFVYSLFQRINWRHHNTSTGVPSLTSSVIHAIDVNIPDKVEQAQIGNFFQNLDQSIALQEKKLSQTQNLKKAMLEKMFPQMGSKRPEIRLKGFSGEWKCHELGEYCDMFNGDRGGNYPNADDMVSVGIPFINAGDLQNGKVDIHNANKITRDKYNQLNGAKIQFGDIVYCLRGTLGKNAYINNFNEGTVASSLVVIRPKNIIGNFLFQILNSDIEYRQRTIFDEGAAQPNLSARNLAGFLIPIPSTEEQKEIGNFFKQLDEMLILQQQQLQTLKNLKQAFLEKMFV